MRRREVVTLLGDAAELVPVPNDYLQRWAVSKHVNSSKVDKEEPSFDCPHRNDARAKRQNAKNLT